jgi:hypothetical protein
MSDERAPKYFQVNSVGNIHGPVGMDVGIWLTFDTDEGELRFKLSHEDAAELEQKLKEEDSIAEPPRQVVSDTAVGLAQLAAELAQQENAAIADKLKDYAEDLRLAAGRMTLDD